MNEREHDGEVAPGLPERLPEGERILWQGAPDWRALANSAFHIRLVAVYFAGLLAWRAVSAWSAGAGPGGTLMAVLWVLPLVAAGLGLLTLLAWLMARTTLYTLTTRRVVMRIGVVLSITFNIPYRLVQSVGLHGAPDGTGDLALALSGEDRIAWLHLWPHVRAWRIARPEPMLRAVPDGPAVAVILAEALVAATGGTARTAVEPAAGHRSQTHGAGPLAPAH